MPADSRDGDAVMIRIKVLIIAKIEVGEITGDFPGEAQLFYEKYLDGAAETPLDIELPGVSFYVNGNIALLLTGEGKVFSSVAVTSVLSDRRFDFSGALILSVGCAGGAVGYTVPGDVVLSTACCDYDLGHCIDSTEFADPDVETTWVPDITYRNCQFRILDRELCDRAFGLIRDIRPDSTPLSAEVMKRNFPGEDWCLRQPEVLRGTSVTGDNYWKGRIGHDNALAVVRYCGAPDPYAATEMEDVAVAVAADAAGLLDRLLCLRVIVNTDSFLDGKDPLSLWHAPEDFNEMVSSSNDETLDIFETGMHNLFRAGERIIDSFLLNGFDL